MAFVHCIIECTAPEALDHGIPFLFDYVIGSPISAPMFMFAMGIGIRGVDSLNINLDTSIIASVLCRIFIYVKIEKYIFYSFVLTNVKSDILSTLFESALAICIFAGVITYIVSVIIS